MDKYPDVLFAIRENMRRDKGRWSVHLVYTAHSVFDAVKEAIEFHNEAIEFHNEAIEFHNEYVLDSPMREDGSIVTSYGNVLPEHIEIQYSMTGLQHSGYCSDASECPRLVRVKLHLPSHTCQENQAFLSQKIN